MTHFYTLTLEGNSVIITESKGTGPRLCNHASDHPLTKGEILGWVLSTWQESKIDLQDDFSIKIIRENGEARS